MVHDSHFYFVLRFLCFGLVCWLDSISPYSFELGLRFKVVHGYGVFPRD